jgi:hypothetical protein
MENSKFPTTVVREIDWARLAMLIDGEGCIRIDVQKPSKGNNNTARHLLEVRVYNCNLDLVGWCRDTFGGGNLKPVRNKNAKPHWKQEHVWYIGASSAEWILINCLPWFIVKRRQAEVALKFRALGVICSAGGFKAGNEDFESAWSITRIN